MTDSRPKFKRGFYSNCLPFPKTLQQEIIESAIDDEKVFMNMVTYKDAPTEYKDGALRWYRELPPYYARKILSMFPDQGHANILWKPNVTRVELFLICKSTSTIEIPFYIDGQRIPDSWTVDHYNQY